MASRSNDLFILGEEELGTDVLDDATAVEDAASGHRSPFPSGPEPAPRTVRPPLGAGRSRRRLVAVALVAGAGALLAVVAQRGGGEQARAPRVDREVAVPTVEPALSAPTRPPRRRLPPRPARAEQLQAPQAAPKPSKRRPTDSAEREPTIEQAPVSPPVDEPVPAPAAAPVPVSPPPAPSPSRPLRDGSGARPEFSFER